MFDVLKTHLRTRAAYYFTKTNKPEHTAMDIASLHGRMDGLNEALDIIKEMEDGDERTAGDKDKNAVA
jgi:hypothetical protein